MQAVGRAGHNASFIRVVVVRIQNFLGAANLADGQVAVGRRTRLNVVHRNLIGGRERHGGFTRFASERIVESSPDDGVVHLAAHGEDSVHRVSARRIDEHLQLVLTIDQVSPVIVTQGDAPAVMRSADQRGVLVATGDFNRVGSTDTIIELELAVLRFDTDEGAQTRTLLLDQHGNVVPVLVHICGINLGGHYSLR